MRRLLTLAFLVISSSHVAADPASPITILVGAGVSRGEIDDWDPSTSTSPSVQVDIGYRSGNFAIGAHFGIAHGTYEIYDNRSMSLDSVDYEYVPLQLGVSGQLVLRDRVTLAPWIGVQERGQRVTACFHEFRGQVSRCDGPQDWELQGRHQLAIGMTAAVDLLAHRSHRLAAYASFTHAVESMNDDGDGYNSGSYTALAVGLGYRFW